MRRGGAVVLRTPCFLSRWPWSVLAGLSFQLLGTNSCHRFPLLRLQPREPALVPGLISFLPSEPLAVWDAFVLPCASSLRPQSHCPLSCLGSLRLPLRSPSCH